MKVLVTGGGTGGHFYPALSVMKKLHEKDVDHQICYVGTGGGLESEIAPDYDWIDFRKITLTGLSRSSFVDFMKGVLYLPVGLIQTLRIIMDFKPDLIYGTGGYTTFPPAFWGILLRIPVITHELNLKPGVTNKLISRFVTEVLLSYPETGGFLTSREEKVTGTPTREEIRESNADIEPEDFGLKPDCPIILVFGGSHGSRVLADKVFTEFEKNKNSENLPFQFLVQTGRENYSRYKNRLEELDTDRVGLIDYVENMGDAYSLSDLVISRGGAGTMAELIEAREPALVVPWEGAAENHQFYNARYLEDNGGALLVEEDEWLDLPLLDTLEEIVTTEGKLKEMSRSYLESDSGSGAKGVIKEFQDIINEGE